MSISVISHEKLNIHKLNEKYKNIIKDLHISDLDAIQNDINHLNFCDYKFIELKLSIKLSKPNYLTYHCSNIEIIYYLVHGFPNDEPVGYILLDNGLYEKVNDIKTNTYFDIDLINKWYNETTKNLGDYEDEHWY
jgi:hypothetical protein